MKLTSIRQNFLINNSVEELFKCSDEDFRVISSLHYMDKILSKYNYSEKTIKEYSIAANEFNLFIKLVNKDIYGIEDTDISLYEDILTRKGYTRRTVKRKIKQVVFYILIYRELNSLDSMQGDFSTNEVLRKLREDDKKRKEELDSLKKQEKELLKQMKGIL